LEHEVLTVSTHPTQIPRDMVSQFGGAISCMVYFSFLIPSRPLLLFLAGSARLGPIEAKQATKRQEGLTKHTWNRELPLTLQELGIGLDELLRLQKEKMRS
jgi:hypothetical protein